MKKDERFVEAVVELKKMVEEDCFGSIQFNFQEGIAVNWKKELTGRFVDGLKKSE